MLFPTMFSRIASQLHGETNPLYTLRDQLRAQGRRIIDLVSGNVNEHGIVFPAGILEQALVDGARRCAIYDPNSFGQKPAREAIAAYYGAQGIPITADRLLLTPGTSVSYWYSFRLLADEGDEILCPSPSYPLFDYIAAPERGAAYSVPAPGSAGLGHRPRPSGSLHVDTHPGGGADLAAQPYRACFVGRRGTRRPGRTGRAPRSARLSATRSSASSCWCPDPLPRPASFGRTAGHHAERLFEDVRSTWAEAGLDGSVG